MKKLKDYLSYKCWEQMLYRCYNKNAINYYLYGKRGISVCDRWKESFFNFLEDMGERPSKNHSLDRINNNGNYEITNCKWATRIEQANNKRNNKIFNHEGEVFTLSQLSKKFGLPKDRLGQRLISGWSLNKALNEPLKKQYQRKRDKIG